MLLAQRVYGSDRPGISESGYISLGCDLFPSLPEDRWDRQPLTGGDGRFSLISDVRLDNRGELAAKFGLSHGDTREFADSEFLLKALERWGRETPCHLLGDFAFAWFDHQENSLLLARDPLGQRPLFWARTPDFVALASMPKGLHVLGEVPRGVSSGAVAHFLEHGALASNESFFAGIERVQPGHAVMITPDTVTRQRYWYPSASALSLPRFDDYVDAYREELDRAVGVRLRSTGSVVATHLSGGWDSSAVTATAARLDCRPIVAFTAIPASDDPTVDPHGRFSNEWPLAESLARQYRSLEHHAVKTVHASPVDILDKGARLFERPLFNVCNHGWLGQIREAARERGARVLLSGEIGNWSISASPINVLRQYRLDNGIKGWWDVAEGLTDRGEARWRGVFMSTFGASLPRNVMRRLDLFSSACAVPSLLRREVRAEFHISDEDPAFDHIASAMRAYSEMDFGEHRKGILGGWGIDKRDPTSDVRLIEFCLSLPSRMLLCREGRRPLARAALLDRLPAAVLENKNKGYQGSEWHIAVSRDRDRISDLIDRIGRDPNAANVIDVQRLVKTWEEWPVDGYESRAVISKYRNVFLQGLTAGHFIISAKN